jgi:hypothetical protein
MKGFSRFWQGSRVVVRSRARVTFPLVAGLIGGAFVRCLPSPDTSGLPPYDGGGFVSTLPDGSFATTDGGLDATIAPVEAGSEDAAVQVEAAPQSGTITGLVIDYSQGNGQGVLPGAIVSVSAPNVATPGTLPPAVTADANGFFTLTNVPAGVALQLGATKPTDLVNGVAYSTTYATVAVGAGQTVTAFPIVHEGCYQTWVLNPGGTDAGNLPVTLDNATCSGPAVGSHPGAYAAMTFDATAFKDPVTNSLWNKSIRVEMIPLAYPYAETGIDLSWALGLPGTTTPSGLLGAAEYRVVKSDPGNADDGAPLVLNNPASDPVSIAVPIFTSTIGAQAISYSYSTGSGAWAVSTVLPSGVDSSETEVSYVTLQVSQLAWWAVASGPPPATTCVTGTLQQAGAPLPNVLVRAAGASYLGASTGLTNATGTFCLDVAAGGDDAGVAIKILPEALGGGVSASAGQAIPITTSTGSCAAPGAAGCMPLGTFALTPGVGCVAGGLLDAGALTTLNAVLQLPNLAYATTAGIQPRAYLGQVKIGATGAFCALSPAGDLQLTQPGSANCYADIDVLSGTTATACGAVGCLDAGGVPFYCRGTLPQ